METSLLKLSAGFGSSFLETGWLAPRARPSALTEFPTQNTDVRAGVAGVLCDVASGGARATWRPVPWGQYATPSPTGGNARRRRSPPAPSPTPNGPPPPVCSVAHIIQPLSTAARYSRRLYSRSLQPFYTAVLQPFYEFYSR